MKSTHLFCSFIFALLLLSACSQEDVIQQMEEQEVPQLSQLYVIAHRGAWNNVDAPENSRIAFERALALKIYGVEFDVRQTKDGRLVICHDATFDGLKIENSSYDELLTRKLANGETIPLLEDFLSIRSKTETTVKLVIDIKNCRIVDLVEQIDKYGLQDEVLYITFTKSYCQQLEKLGYGENTYYSDNGTTPAEIKEMGFGGVCYKSTFLVANQEYIEAASSLNIKIMVWTVNSFNNIHDFSLKGVYVITDNPKEF